LNSFPRFKVVIENGEDSLSPASFSIEVDQQPVKVYTARSLTRESSHLATLINKAADDKKKLIWIAPYHRDIEQNLPIGLSKNLIWVAPALFTPTSGDSVIGSEDSLLYFIREITRKDRFAISTHRSIPQEVQVYISKQIEEGAIRLKTIEHFAKRWEYNFRRNLTKWQQAKDISEYNGGPPDLIILGGPQVDRLLEKPELIARKILWCADTALGTLLHHQIVPQLVFSIDAGHGSMEHFIGLIQLNNKLPKRLALVVDPLSFPGVFKPDWQEVYSYSSSHPLVTRLPAQKTFIENKTGDLGGCIDAVLKKLFPDSAPPVYGGDRKHHHKVTHLRGSAYHRFRYRKINRLSTPELYFFHLSKRFDGV